MAKKKAQAQKKTQPKPKKETAKKKPAAKKPAAKKEPAKKAAPKKKEPAKKKDAADIQKEQEAAVAEVIKDGGKIFELEPSEIRTMKEGQGIARAVMGDVDGLAESIRTEGQIQPIVVRQVKAREGNKRFTGYVLIAGSRRRAACEKLGIKVKCIIAHPENLTHFLDMQIAENVHRKEFDLLEMAEALTLRKSQYDKDHGTGRGATGRGRPKAEDAPERFTKHMADKLGVHESTISRLMQADALSDEVKEQVNAAETSEERNRIVREALRAEKKKAKVEKLQKAAEAKAAAREAEYSEEEDDDGEDLDEELDEEESDEDDEEGEGLDDDDEEDGDDEDDDEEEEEPPKQKRGKKKPPARVAMYEGDFREVMPEILGEGAIDLILTDPPYGLDRNPVGHEDRTDIGEDVSWDDLDVGWVLDVVDYLADDGQIIAFCPLEEIGNYKEVFEEAEMIYKGAIIWHKPDKGTVHRDTYLQSCEAIVWACKSKKYHFVPWEDQKAGRHHNFFENSVCRGNERIGDLEAQKPVAVMERLLLRHSAEGFRVLDPFAGYGTTIVACARNNRMGVGIEQLEEHFEIADTRVKAES